MSQRWSGYSSNIRECPEQQNWLGIEENIDVEEEEDEARGKIKLMMDTVEKVEYTEEKDAQKSDTLEYIAGLMQFATREKVYTILEDEEGQEEDVEGDQQLTFLDLVNQGGLMKPPKDLVREVEKLEKVFRSTKITCRDFFPQ